MRLLVIGGTRFLGRHLAQQALEGGHEVTLLHRGRSATPASLFLRAEHLIADRDGDLAVLAGARTWDAAIDTCAYVPRHVRTLAERLAGRVGQYQLVSTISVYASMDGERTDEDAALAELPDPSVEAVTGDTYGGLKVLCERAAAAGFAARGTPVLVARPGLLVGPFDPTGRFTWWVQRVARGGPTLAPGDPAQPVQFIDARDAAAWMLRQAESTCAGIFNLTGPTAALSMRDLLETARQVLASDAAFEWVDERYLLDQGVAPWTELPLWLPQAQAGLHRTELRRALAAGLHCRPLQQTLSHTWAWAAGLPATPSAAPAPAMAGAPARPPVGMASEREQQLLQGWRQTQRSD